MDGLSSCRDHQAFKDPERPENFVSSNPPDGNRWGITSMEISGGNQFAMDSKVEDIR